MKTLALLLLAATASAQVPCDGTVNDTAWLQAHADAGGERWLEPGRTYCVDGRVGVTVRGSVRLRLAGATLAMIPGCVLAPGVCRVIQTAPGGSLEIEGPGEIVGDPVGSWAHFSIPVRGDSGVLVLRNLTIRDSRSDLVWVGGNSPSRATLDRVTLRGSGRNNASFVNADEVTIVDSVFSDNWGDNPGALADFEPSSSPVEIVRRVTILRSRFERGKVGIYIQKGVGLPGEDYALIGNTVTDNRAIGVVLNAVRRGLFAGNTVTGSPIAVSSGGFTATTLAERVVYVGNTLQGPVGLRLAGSKHPFVAWNVGLIQQVALGASGDVVLLGNQ